jgi:hypothetical protein
MRIQPETAREPELLTLSHPRFGVAGQRTMRLGPQLDALRRQLQGSCEKRLEPRPT